MANEIQYTITLTYANVAYNIPALTITSGADAVSITDEPGPFQRNVLQLSTSKTAIPTALIGTLGLAILHNCDATASVNVYAASGDTTPLLTIGPGVWQLVQFSPAATPNVQATAGTPLFEYLALSD
jgi:hypothetical protein